MPLTITSLYLERNGDSWNIVEEIFEFDIIGGDLNKG